MQTKVWHAHAGWRTPMILVQFSPIQWAFGACWGCGKYGFSLGPLSIVVYIRLTPFECDIQKDL